MLKEAVAFFGADPKRTPVIGDEMSDMEAAAALGCPRHLVRTGQGTRTEAKLRHKVAPVQVHEDLWGAIGSLLATKVGEVAH
jgi:histidinol phosphatase-like enzyme